MKVEIHFDKMLFEHSGLGIHVGEVRVVYDFHDQPIEEKFVVLSTEDDLSVEPSGCHNSRFDWRDSIFAPAQGDVRKGMMIAALAVAAGT